MRSFARSSLALGLVVALLGTSFASANPRSCSGIFGEELLELTYSQTTAVSHLAAGDYVSSVQKVNVDGIERLVVIVGERHVKSKEDAERFNALFEHFLHFGNEGVDTSSYWFPKALAKAVNHEKTAELSEGSSLHETAVRAHVGTMEAVLIQSAVDMISTKKRTFKEVAEFLKAEAVKSSIATSGLNDVETVAYYSTIIDRIDFESLKAQVRVKLAEAGLQETEEAQENVIELKEKINPAKLVTAYPLESGYKPSLRENLGNLLIAATSKILSYKKCTAAGICAISAGSFWLTQSNIAIYTGIAAQFFVPTGAAILRTIGFNNIFAVERRNDHMVKSLAKILRDNPKIEKVVFTVGSAHVPDILKILKRFGSQDVPLGTNADLINAAKLRPQRQHP